jgi:Carboxypeptidase regulatory-like domain/TonB dependent receptor
MPAKALLRSCCSCLIFLLFHLGVSQAQVDRADLNGTVTDAAGQPIPGVNVVAVQESTGLKRSAISSAEGAYDIPQLPVGTYSVTFSQSGFAPLVVKDVVQTVGQTRTLNATMQVTGIVQTVQVSGDVTPLDETSATIGERVERNQIQSLPLNGRNWATLTALVPGGIDSGGSNQRTIRFADRGLDDNNFTYDGVDATNILNQAQQPYVRLAIPTESIQEFRVQSMLFTADNGSTPGGQMAVASTSGTNQFHGTVFDYLRNDVFDARNPFDYLNPTYPKPPFRLNQFGGSISGPIVRNKTFFYVTYEGIRQSLGQTLIGYVPSDSFRAQVEAESPALVPVINAYPRGQTNITKQIAQVVQEGQQIDNENSGMFRLDQIFTQKTTAYLRFNYDAAITVVPLGASGLYLSDQQQSNSTPVNGIIELLHIFSNNWVDEAKFGFNRSTAYRTNLSTLDSAYSISVPGFTKLNTNQQNIGAGNSFGWIDNVTWVHGRHTVKFGGEVRRVQLNQGNTANGTITYASLANFAANLVNAATYAAELPVNGLRKTQVFAYIQDEYKVSPTLTLNLGLRYQFFSRFHEVKNRAIPFDFATCGPQGFCGAGAEFSRPNLLDLDPRVAAAWAPSTLGGKTVLRAGFGTYHGDGQLDDQNLPIANEVQRYSLSSKTIPNLSSPIGPFLPYTPGIVSPRDMYRLRNDMYVTAWSVSVQQQLARNWVGTLTYAGSTGTYLLTTSYINLIDPVAGQRPYPNFGQVEYRGNNNSSSFNAFQASIQRNFSGGFSLSANYQWSHEIDNGSLGGGEADFPQNPLCMPCEQASGDYDARHVFHANGIYNLPFGQGQRYLSNPGVVEHIVSGWSFTAIFSGRTGIPVNVLVDRTASSVPTGDTVNQRPNLVPGVSLSPPPGSSPLVWINPAAFVAPAAGTEGNLPRNFLRGPGIWQTDVGLQKQMPLTERVQLLFRVEAFNLFNRAQYGQPQSDITSPTFGYILNTVNTGPVGTGTPRQLQFMLRLNF